MQEDRQPVEWRRDPWVVFAISFYVCVALWALLLDTPSTGWWWLWNTATTPLYCAYCLASVLVAASLVQKMRGRSEVSRPSFPQRLAAKPRLQAALAVGVVLITLAREGAFGSTLSVDYNAYSINDRIKTNSSTTAQQGGPASAQSYAGRDVTCEITCTEPGHVCGAVLAELGCNGRTVVDAMPPVTITGEIRLVEPWCFVPWYKKASVRFFLDADFEVADSEQGQTLSLSGVVEQTGMGPISCRQFRQHAGNRIGGAVVSSLDEVLQSH